MPYDLAALEVDKERYNELVKIVSSNSLAPGAASNVCCVEGGLPLSDGGIDFEQEFGSYSEVLVENVNTLPYPN